MAKAQPDIDRSIAAVREGRPLPPPHDRLYDRFMSGLVNPIFYACFVKSSAFTVSRPAPARPVRPPLSHQQHHPPGRQARLGAKAAPTAWPVSATAPRPPSSTEKEPRQAPVSFRSPVSPPARRWPPPRSRSGKFPVLLLIPPEETPDDQQNEHRRHHAKGQQHRKSSGRTGPPTPATAASAPQSAVLSIRLLKKIILLPCIFPSFTA